MKVVLVKSPKFLSGILRMIFGIKSLVFPIVYLIFGLNKEVIEDALNTSKLSRKEINLQNMEKSFCEDDDEEQNDEDFDQSRL